MAWGRLPHAGVPEIVTRPTPFKAMVHFCLCRSPPLWAMACRTKLRACYTPIAHGVGSYKKATP